MELNFKSLEEYLQGYMNGGKEVIVHMGEVDIISQISLENDLNQVTASQRLGFIEKYMEFVSPKQLRRGTSLAS
ncbi:hypothetical protein LCGC14_2790940, partial [marine sediment metagenome]